MCYLFVYSNKILFNNFNNIKPHTGINEFT